MCTVTVYYEEEEHDFYDLLTMASLCSSLVLGLGPLYLIERPDADRNFDAVTSHAGTLTRTFQPKRLSECATQAPPRSPANPPAGHNINALMQQVNKPLIVTF